MTTYATPAQLSTIRDRRVDDEARDMMATGVTLSHDQADELGDEACDWIASRLGLHVATDDRGVRYTPES